MNVKTPGREDETATSSQQVTASEQAEQIIAGLGGAQNIQLVDNCFTRLRVKVKDMDKIKDDSLKATGASGIKRASDEDVQVIYGPQVESIANDVKQALAI